MKISDLINSLFSPKINPYNFVNVSKGELNRWLFHRESDTGGDYIEIDKSNWHKNSLRISFYNAKSNTNSYRLVYNERVKEWHQYSDEESLVKLLHFFVDVTEKYALDWFSKNQPDKPKDVFYPVANGEAVKDFVRTFIHNNSLDLNEPIPTIEFLEKKLQDDLSDDTIRITTYVYGEVYISNHGGQWNNSTNNGIPYIENFGGIEGFKILPHEYISKFIKGSKIGLSTYYLIKVETLLNIKSENK